MLLYVISSSFSFSFIDPNWLFSKGVSFVFGILFTGIVLADLDIIVTSVVMTRILDLYDSFEPLLVA